MPTSAKHSDSRSKSILATPEQIFAAFSDPARLARWWGPDGFRSTIHQFEFFEGGTLRLTLHAPDGANYENLYQLRRITPYRLIEIDHPAPDHDFVLNLEFVEQGAVTVVHWHQRFAHSEQYTSIAEFLAQANEQVLTRLEAEVLRAG